jgi:hypothetical protein
LVALSAAGVNRLELGRRCWPGRHGVLSPTGPLRYCEITISNLQS